jgi:hypothetical protein
MIRNASRHDPGFGEDVRRILAASERLQLVSGEGGEQGDDWEATKKLLESRDCQVGFVCMVDS